MSYIYISQKNTEMALQMMEKALALSKWNHQILNNSSYLYLLKGDIEKAIINCEILLSLDKYYLIAYWNLSNAYRLNGNFLESYNLLKQLIQLLDNSEVISLEKNANAWLFEVKPNGETVYFSDISQKLCYSYYSMALTCYLLDKQDETQTFMEKAKNLNVYRKNPCSLLILSDIFELESRQKQVTKILEIFKTIYLSSTDTLLYMSINGWDYETRGSQNLFNSMR